MNFHRTLPRPWRSPPALILAAVAAACGKEPPPSPILRWYVFDEPSGAFQEAALNCSDSSAGRYIIEVMPLPADADRQREQLVRRLAAGDNDIDIIGMDVIWTAEFAEAGWILPWDAEGARRATEGRLGAPVESVRYEGRTWGAPFTTNAQLLWYRTDRVESPPRTWDEMMRMAQTLGDTGTILAQGERYEGLTVFFVSLLASAGGSVLGAPENDTARWDSAADPSREDPVAPSREVALSTEPTLQALRIMGELARSPATAPNLDRAREDHARLAFEAGEATFMVNYTYVWPSARENAPEVARNMGWARWPGVEADRPSRVTVGGINLAVGAFSRHPELAFEAAACIASEENQRIAVTRGGLPPTSAALYDEEAVREMFPFADLLRETLRAAVQRPRSPLYNDVSLAISRTLHPMSEIDPREHLERLRETLRRALRSEGLL